MLPCLKTNQKSRQKILCHTITNVWLRSRKSCWGLWPASNSWYLSFSLGAGLRALNSSCTGQGWASGAGSPWPLVTNDWCWKQSSRWGISIYHYLCSRLSVFSRSTKVQKSKDSKLTVDVSLTSSISVIFSPYEDIICLQVTTAFLFPLWDYHLRGTKKVSLSAFMTNGDYRSTVLCFSLNRFFNAFFMLCPPGHLISECVYLWKNLTQRSWKTPFL